MKTKSILAVALVGALALLSNGASAGEIGHYSPGVANIRDYVVPDPGFYGVLYNYYYTTDRLNDRNGNKVNSITINPGGGSGVTLPVSVNVDVYAVSPVFIWVSDWKVLGAKYGAYIAPSFANNSVSGSLTTESGSGINPEAGQFAMGDLFVQPLWLGWSLTNWDFALGYGFYAPVGKYDTKTVTLPVIGPIKVAAADNVGLGYWEQQIQGAGAWYPWADKRMAVCAALTYTIPQEKQDFNLTPGQHLTLNWGISQYVPLTKDQNLLLEVGPAGYDSWQTTDDTGSAASNPGMHDQVHAVGGQLGLTYVPWMLSVNALYFNEFSATDRFQGQSFSLNISKKF